MEIRSVEDIIKTLEEGYKHWKQDNLIDAMDKFTDVETYILLNIKSARDYETRLKLHYIYENLVEAIRYLPFINHKSDFEKSYKILIEIIKQYK